MKSVVSIAAPPPRHWVGDGFPMQGLFDYGAGAEARSPFLLLDYGAPTRFEPHDGAPRGVGTHPHRGIETVTIVYDGEVAHRDSSGGGGTIGPGDVQWMTAGAGILHQEFHAPAYSRRGGPFHMVQLWVDLPARDKGLPPRYQAILDADIPAVALPDEAGRVRVIAGELAGRRGPAQTCSPMNVWDLQLRAGHVAGLAQPEGWTTLLLVQQGAVRVNGGENGGEIARAGQLVTLSHAGSALTLAAEADARALLMAGQPLGQPVVGYGPFVMNSREQIAQAMADLRAGRFGHMD